ncbi:hypothetical protein AGMMS49992_12450 [Clostridia bacterium]|nr:hypothetical protein AGMMS49992_12450 [Clostridia bacterium]
MNIDEVGRWFKLGDHDLLNAEFITEHNLPIPEIVCFHCQQAAEKYLKGYIRYIGQNEIPRTHDITYLAKLCSTLDPVPDSTFNGVQLECCTLSMYAMIIWGPDFMDVNNKDAELALVFAKTIRDLEPLQTLRAELDTPDTLDTIQEEG